MSPANYAAVIAAIDPDDETILMSGHSSVASSLGNVDWNAAGAEGSLLGTLSTYRQAARLAYEGRPDSTLTDRLKAYDNPFFARAIDNIDAVAQNASPKPPDWYRPFLTSRTPKSSTPSPPCTPAKSY